MPELPDSARKLRYSLLGRRFRSTKCHDEHLFVQLNSSGWLAMTNRA